MAVVAYSFCRQADQGLHVLVRRQLRVCEEDVVKAEAPQAAVVAVVPILSVEGQEKVLVIGYRSHHEALVSEVCHEINDALQVWLGTTRTRGNRYAGGPSIVVVGVHMTSVLQGDYPNLAGAQLFPHALKNK